MVTKTIGRRGELVIPKNIRKHQNLVPHQQVEVMEIEGGILIIPIDKDIKNLAGLFGEFKGTNLKKLDNDALDFMYDM
tara:strand:- start:1399 stop:1632 length:234 start_codon:yes stop_codon:yes gene_type:complete